MRNSPAPDERSHPFLLRFAMPAWFWKTTMGKTFHFLLLRVAGRKVFVRVSHFLRFAYDVKYIAERFLLTGAYF